MGQTPAYIPERQSWPVCLNSHVRFDQRNRCMVKLPMAGAAICEFCISLESALLDPQFQRRKMVPYSIFPYQLLHKIHKQGDRSQIADANSSWDRQCLLTLWLILSLRKVYIAFCTLTGALMMAYMLTFQKCFD